MADLLRPGGDATVGRAVAEPGEFDHSRRGPAGQRGSAPWRGPSPAHLVFGGPPECPERPYCLRGLREVYGLQFGEFRIMASRAATVEALLAGEIHVGLLETTDARLATAPLVLLEHDRSLQPHENVVPIVRTEVLDQWGEPLRTALDRVSARLTTKDLIELNHAVSLDGRTPAEAALRWWGDTG